MEAWDYALARALRDLPKGQIPALVEGTVVSAAPLTVSLYGGEVMAPPGAAAGALLRPGILPGQGQRPCISGDLAGR